LQSIRPRTFSFPGGIYKCKELLNDASHIIKVKKYCEASKKRNNPKPILQNFFAILKMFHTTLFKKITIIFT
jgi:hypothetical protein